MKHNHDNRAENAELDASLKRLGIRELEERMEVAPLLMEDGTGAGAGEVVDDSFMEMCCVCKIGEPIEDPVYPTMDPNGGVPSTGPTNPYDGNGR